MVAVLMSTYNGSAFLKEQLDSILNQSHSDFVLYIRDDGSTDDTCDLIREYTDPRIRFSQGENLGPSDSFFRLIGEAADADYLFFSDQDDVWYPDKLERMLAQIKKYDDIPTMVFSDFAMIDETGRKTHNSFYDYASVSLSGGAVGVEKILAHPFVFGCASVINRKLAEYVQNPPTGIEMHDCWIALSAAAIGKLVYMPVQTIAHRFHSSNATGRKGQTNLLTRLKRVTAGFSAQVENTALRLHQVTLLLTAYDQQLLPEAARLLRDLSEAMAAGKLSAVRALHRYGITRQGKANTMFFYMTVMGIKGEIQ